MAYFIASIITITSALIILMTRYEADDSNILAELDRVKSMFLMIDHSVDTYIQSGGNLTDINFEVLFDAGILLGNIEKSAIGNTDKDIDGEGFASVLSFPRSSIRWQLIPVRNITPEPDNTDFGNSAGSAYKLLVDMSQNRDLIAKGRFSESFAGREFCEKMLFGTVQYNGARYDPSVDQEDFIADGTNNDGLFVCIVFK